VDGDDDDDDDDIDALLLAAAVVAVVKGSRVAMRFGNHHIPAIHIAHRRR